MTMPMNNVRIGRINAVVSIWTEGGYAHGAVVNHSVSVGAYNFWYAPASGGTPARIWCGNSSFAAAEAEGWVVMDQHQPHIAELAADIFRTIGLPSGEALAAIAAATAPVSARARAYYNDNKPYLDSFLARKSGFGYSVL